MEKNSPAGTQEQIAERRKCTRHQFVERVILRTAGGKSFSGMSFEIGVAGMSGVFPGLSLELGERVELMPVAGYQLDAVVRHVRNFMYGFEFLGLEEEHVRALEEKCKRLPLFKTMLDV